MTLDQLIEKLEKATVGSRELDKDVYRLTDWPKDFASWKKVYETIGIDPKDPLYISDQQEEKAAMNTCLFYTLLLTDSIHLLPHDCSWSISYINVGDEDEIGYWVTLTKYKTKNPEDGWLYHNNHKGATAPLAVCIASLTALKEIP
jgi:hypothetical protein